MSAALGLCHEGNPGHPAANAAAPAVAGDAPVADWDDVSHALSFLCSLIRGLAAEHAQVTRQVWELCADGFGHAMFSVNLGGHSYSLVTVSADLPPALRTDRVIAGAWDKSYVLFDGLPGADDIARINANAPLQDAGRFGPCDQMPFGHWKCYGAGDGSFSADASGASQ